MEDTRKLRDIILDQCDAKDIRLEEVAKKTGMPEQYLDAIINNVRTRLPAFPYVRAHLVRLASLLGLPAEVLLEKYRTEFAEKVSGGSDMLPGNRFALPSGRRQYLIITAVITGLLIIYGISRTGFLGRPQLVITMPPVGVDPFITASATIALAGSISGNDKLLINGQPVATDDQGAFLKEYPLTPEINIFEFSATRFLGREARVTRQVYYEEPPAAAAARAAPRESLEEPAGTAEATTSDAAE